MDVTAYDPLAFMSRKVLRDVVAASIGYIVAWQHYNSERHKQETEAELKETQRALFGSLNTSVFTVSLVWD